MVLEEAPAKPTRKKSNLVKPVTVKEPTRTPKVPPPAKQQPKEHSDLESAKRRLLQLLALNSMSQKDIVKKTSIDASVLERLLPVIASKISERWTLKAEFFKEVQVQQWSSYSEHDKNIVIGNCKKAYEALKYSEDAPERSNISFERKALMNDKKSIERSLAQIAEKKPAEPPKAEKRKVEPAEAKKKPKKTNIEDRVQSEMLESRNLENGKSRAEPPKEPEKKETVKSVLDEFLTPKKEAEKPKVEEKKPEPKPAPSRDELLSQRYESLSSKFSKKHEKYASMLEDLKKLQCEMESLSRDLEDPKLKCFAIRQVNEEIKKRGGASKIEKQREELLALCFELNDLKNKMCSLY